MSKSNSTALSWLLLVTSVSFLGCAHGPRSGYQTFYQNRLAAARLPTYEEIASVGDSLLEPLDQPTSEVWNVCLGFAAQSRGVLAAADDPNGGHRLLLISGETLEYKRDQSSFIDRWLVISARPIAEGATEVRVAFVSPKTGKVVPFSADSPPKGFKADEQLSVSRKAAENFILALRKTFLEDEYLVRFAGVSHPPARGVPPDIEGKPDERGESAAQQGGNYRSAVIRRERFVLSVPRLEERIAGVIHDIAVAAGQPRQDTEIFIVADDPPSFQVESNGDLLITTGALDKIQDIDELAGILAHELAHIYLHHGSMRVGGFRRAGKSKSAIIFAFMLGGAVASGLLPSSKPEAVSPEDAAITNQELIVATGVTLGTWYLSIRAGFDVGRGIGFLTIHQFTRKQELEADEYGAELLWAAGYNYRGLLKLLRRQGDSKLFVTRAKGR